MLLTHPKKIGFQRALRERRAPCASLLLRSHAKLRCSSFPTDSTGVLCCVCRLSPPMNPRTGGLFHATAATESDCAGAGSGERCVETKKMYFKKAPAPDLTQHRAAAARSSLHRHTPPRQQRGHATGPVSAHRRDGMFRAAIYERHWDPACIVRRSSSSSVVHAHVCDNHRLVATMKTAFAVARLTKS